MPTGGLLRIETQGSPTEPGSLALVMKAWAAFRSLPGSVTKSVKLSHLKNAAKLYRLSTAFAAFWVCLVSAPEARACRDDGGDGRGGAACSDVYVQAGAGSDGERAGRDSQTVRPPARPATCPCARQTLRAMCTVPTAARCGSAPRVRRRLQSRAEDIARDSGELGQEATTELMDKLEGQMGQLIELQHEVRDRQHRQYRQYWQYWQYRQYWQYWQY